MKTKYRWIIEGTIYGLIMFVFSILLDVMNDDFSIDVIWKKILIWIVGGLIFGFGMKFVRSKKSLN